MTFTYVYVYIYITIGYLIFDSGVSSAWHRQKAALLYVTMQPHPLGISDSAFLRIPSLSLSLGLLLHRFALALFGCTGARAHELVRARIILFSVESVSFSSGPALARCLEERNVFRDSSSVAPADVGEDRGPAAACRYYLSMCWNISRMYITC